MDTLVGRPSFTRSSSAGVILVRTLPERAIRLPLVVIQTRLIRPAARVAPGELLLPCTRLVPLRLVATSSPLLSLNIPPMYPLKVSLIVL